MTEYAAPIPQYFVISFAHAMHICEMMHQVCAVLLLLCFDFHDGT